MSQASTDSYHAIVAEIMGSDFHWDTSGNTIEFDLANTTKEVIAEVVDPQLTLDSLYQLFTQVLRLKVHSLQPCGLYDAQLDLVCGFQPLLTLEMKHHLYRHWQWTWLCPFDHGGSQCHTLPNPELLHAHLRVHHGDHPQLELDAYYALVRQFGPTNTGSVPPWLFTSISLPGETPLTAHRRILQEWVHQTYIYTKLEQVELAMASPWLDVEPSLMARCYGLGYPCPLSHPNNHDAIVFSTTEELRGHFQRYHAMTTDTQLAVVDSYLVHHSQPTALLVNNALRDGVTDISRCHGDDAVSVLKLLDPN